MSDLIDGALRLANGILERYIKNDDLWVLPDQYAFFQTSKYPVRNFGNAQLLQCNGNMYSVDCWENMNQIFNAGKDGNEILSFFSQSDTWVNFLLNVVFGGSLFWSWIFFGLPIISAAPDLALPPATDNGYAHMGLIHWLWYKYLSLDQQIVMMFWGMQFTGL